MGFFESNVSTLGWIPTEGYTTSNEMLLLTHPLRPKWQGQQLFRAGNVCSVLGAHQVPLMSYQVPAPRDQCTKCLGALQCKWEDFECTQHTWVSHLAEVSCEGRLGHEGGRWCKQLGGCE